MIRSYRDLRVWQISIDFAAATYASPFQKSNSDARSLIDQLRRAAASVPANIAEGYGRGSARSYAQFLRIARGSLNEAETHILLASRLGLLELERAEHLLETTTTISKMLNSLIKSVAAGSGNRAAT